MLPLRALRLLLIAATLPTALTAQGWDRYKPGTLTAITVAHDSALRALGAIGAPHWLISGKDFATAARLGFTGEHRPMSTERRELLRRWQTGFGVDARVLDAFAEEYRFTDDSTEAWVVVQRPLEAPLREEVRLGSTFTAMVTFIGGHYAGQEVTWLFLMNEFQADEP